MSETISVVCNAGPLIALGKLNRLDLLGSLYSEVQLPDTVYEEVVYRGAARGEPDAHAVRLFWQQQKWPVVTVTPEMVSRIKPGARLGRGEITVLALANTLVNPIVLMDDAVARAEARRMGLPVRGTLAILVQAYRRQLLSLAQVEWLMQELATRPDIWISPRLCREVLAQLRSSIDTEV